jgi:hypothetical protein
MAALGYAAAAVIVFLALGLAEARLVLRRSAPMSHLLALWLGVALALAILVLATGGSAAVPVAIASVAVYLFVVEVVLFVYAAALTSLSIRILVDAVEREPDRDALIQAFAQHPPGSFLDVRLETFLANGRMTLTAGRYRVTRAGGHWARTARALKRILAVGPGG